MLFASQLVRFVKKQFSKTNQRANEKKSSPDKLSERPYKKSKDENPDEEEGPPIKEMPITGSPYHPHHEEILDSTPK